MKYYIEFIIDENDMPMALVHKEGKVRRVKNVVNIEKLLELCEEEGYVIDDVCTITRHSRKIIEKFDKYMERKKRLRIFNAIKEEMKLVTKNPLVKKTLIASTLAAVILTKTLGGVATADKDVGTIETDTKAYHSSQMIMDETYQDESSLDYLEEIDNLIINENDYLEDNNDEIDSMFENNSFEYSYNNRCNEEAINNAKRYENLFAKYAHRYGMDKNLLMAMAAQEGGGLHEENLRSGLPAAGIMQIEKAVFIGERIQAYNFETGKMDYITVTPELLNDVESNIKIGTMILRDCIENSNYNIPLSTQTYNMGYGNIANILNACSNGTNKSLDYMYNNPNYNGWLDYRNIVSVGDSKYVEHVFSYLQPNTELSVLRRDGSKVSVNISNTTTLEKNNTY